MFLPVRLDETAPLLPTPPGARTIEPPHAFGPRVEASFCVDSDPEIAAAHTRDALAGAGWPDATATPIAGVPTRFLLAAHKDRYVLAGYLDRSVPGCDAVFVTYGVHSPGPDASRPPATADQPRIIGRP